MQVALPSKASHSWQHRAWCTKHRVSGSRSASPSEKTFTIGDAGMYRPKCTDNNQRVTTCAYMCSMGRFVFFLQGSFQKAQGEQLLLKDLRLGYRKVPGIPPPTS